DVRGVLPYAYELVPGDYRGKSYPSFARILNVGDFNTTSLRLTNVGDESLTVTLNASTLNVTSSASHAFSVNFTAPAAEFILNATGLFNLNGTVLLSMPAGAFQQADVLRISIFTELDSMLLDAEYLLEVMDWTDVDGDSVFDGVEERNRIVTDWVVNTDLRGPNGRQFIHRPVERTHDGLYIWLRPINQGSLNQMSAVLQLDFMRREPFPWIDVSPSTHVLAAQQTKEFSVNTTVPQDASSGIYQSALLIDWETNTTTVPITLSVATDVLPLEIGGPRTFGTYDGGLVYGAGWKDDPGSGDFRYFYLDLGEEPAETLSLAINWTSNDTWVEAYALSPTEDWFSDHLPQRYGDYALGLTGANRLPHGRGITLQMNLTQGLNLLVIRSVFVSGAALSENFSLNVLSASLTPAFITGQGVPVDGVLNLTLVADTSLPQLEVVGRGFSKPIIVEEESIAVGELKEYSFSIKLGGYIEVVTDGTDDLDIDLLLWYMHPILSWIVVGSSGLTGPEERIFATLPPDGPYVLQVFAFSALEGSRFNMSVDFVQGAGVMPRTPPESLTSGQPQDLRVDYRLPHFGGAFRGVVLAGLSSNPDLAMAFVEFEADLPPVFSNLQVPPGSFINDPSPVLSLDMDDAPDDHYTGVNVSSVNVQVDGLDFTGAAEITAYSVRLEVPVVLTDGTHTARVTAKDLAGNENATSWNFTVDTVSPGLQVESLPGMINSTLISLKGSVEVGALLFVQDMPWGYDSQGNFTANIVLVEGAQIIVVRAVDLAGNEAVLTFEVTVDTQPPSLQIEEPLDGDVTTEAMIAVRGTTESGSILTVNGLRLDVGPDGLFDARIGLEAGLNTLRFAARDVAGNEATAVIRITFNPPEESLRTELEETMAELNATRNELETLREELNSTQGEINQTRRDLEAAQRELRLLIGTLSAAVVASLLVLAVGAGVVVFVLYLIFVRQGRLGPPRRF
ncbi:MAG: Ig-like domain-containing protein, partial [Thermoplasmata archaeon]